MDGSDALERHLSATCRRVREEVLRLVGEGDVEALLLGGGYGRGEGGVLRTAEGDKPYNDLEYYVLTRTPRLLSERKWREPLHELGERLSPDAGLEVEFKVLDFRALRAGAVTMFTYDLAMGHRWVVGEESMLAGCEHLRNAAGIPAHEATRLLFNRCSGLLFSAERLSRGTFGPEESDFVGRNLAKVQLALGDALLALRRAYHWSCRERHARLEALRDAGLPAWFQEVLNHHSQGVDFKLHPVRVTDSRERLAARHRELSGLAMKVWLWSESSRLGRAFASARDYALDPGNKCPEQPVWRNALVNARAFGLGAAFGSGGFRYPREGLFRALALLLWEPATFTDPALAGAVRVSLRCGPGGSADLAGSVQAYERIWRRFN